MKIKKSDLLNMIQEQGDVIAKLIRQVNCHHEDIIRIESVTEPESQLKQLDQSVFDGLDEKWRFAVICSNGERIAYADRPTLSRNQLWWSRLPEHLLIDDEGYDASNWQNSLIERDTAKELTGSELCKAMLERGDRYVSCIVSDEGSRDDITHVIRAYSNGKFYAKYNRWTYAIPINNQGKPLTASEVGL